MSSLIYDESVISTYFHIPSYALHKLNKDEVCLLEADDGFNDKLKEASLKCINDFYTNEIIPESIFNLCAIDLYNAYNEMINNEDQFWYFYKFINILNTDLIGFVQYRESYYYDTMNTLFYIAYPDFKEQFKYYEYLGTIFTFRFPAYYWIKVKSIYYNQ